MKRIVLVAAAALLITASAFATDENKVSVTVKESFKAEFKDAKEVEWTVKTDFTKVAFEENGARVTVFYDPQGNRIGKSHTISLEEIPLSAKKMIAKKYAGHNIVEAVEFNGVEGDAYYLTAESDNEKVILKVVDQSTVTTYKKMKKGKN